MTLRDVIDEDLPIFFENQRDPEASRMAAVPSRELDAFMLHWRTNVLGNAENLKQTIVVDGKVAGNVVSFSLEGRRLVGYWIGKAYWGRGIASAALAEFIAVHERRRPLHAEVVVANVGSRRVLEKCGFVAVGNPTLVGDGVEELLMQLTAAAPIQRK